MRKSSLIVLVVAAGLAGVGLVTLTAEAAAPTVAAVQRRLADTPLGRFIQGRIGRALILRSELNVTEAQRQQVRAILESYRSDIAAVVKPLVAKRRALREATMADQPDEKAIRAAADELGKAIGDAAVLGAKVKGEARKVLSDSQVERIKQFQKDNDESVDAFLDQVAGGQ